jgi:C-terminal processing protease CtpA/Prc
MRIRPVYILLSALALAGIAGISFLSRSSPPQPPDSEMPVPPQPLINEPEQDVRPTPQPPPEQQEENTIAGRAIVPPQEAQEPAPERTDPTEHYWRRHALHFEQQQMKLTEENDPIKRLNLIRTMARNIRINTSDTIEWAMGLADPAEQRAALEAINNHALVGIGAHIQLDETGFPKIMQTTPLSAIESTGMTQPGDYIRGMVGEHGEPIYFKGLPIHQIVQALRGKPGTEIQLLMERRTTDEASPYRFEVPVSRSMIVIQPLHE